MKNDITRLLSASVYLDKSFRLEILKLAKDKYHAIVGSFSLDSKLILHHSILAEKKDRKIYYFLFVPAIILFFTVLLIVTSNDYDRIIFGSTVVFILFFISYILVSYFELKNRNYLLKNFTQDSFSTSLSFSHPLLNALQEKTSENIVCYSGFSPFVGRGEEVEGWSFVIDIDRGLKSLGKVSNPEKFEIEELYEMINKNILSLNISNLTIKDEIFVNGKKI